MQVEGITIDSREVKKDFVFVAVKGAGADGHQFIDKAIENGAIAIVCEDLPLVLNDAVVYIQTANSAASAGYMAHNFYGTPSEKMKVVGVTGTNGKTTIATLLYKLFTSLGYTCGLLSTVDNHIGGTVVPASIDSRAAFTTSFLQIFSSITVGSNCRTIIPFDWMLLTR